MRDYHLLIHKQTDSQMVVGLSGSNAARHWFLILRYTITNLPINRTFLKPHFFKNINLLKRSSTDVKDFLTCLAVKRKVSASSQNQAFNARFDSSLFSS